MQTHFLMTVHFFCFQLLNLLISHLHPVSTYSFTMNLVSAVIPGLIFLFTSEKCREGTEMRK